MSFFEIFKALGFGMVLGVVGVFIVLIPVLLLVRIRKLEESTLKAMLVLQEDQNNLTKKLVLLYNLLEVMNTLSTYTSGQMTHKPTKPAPVLKIMKPIELDLDLPPVDNKNEV